MPSNVLFVHGYSESSLGAYFGFPEILKGAVPSIKRVALAAFDSLDDSITIEDLARAMENRVLSLAEADWDVADSAVICHSTGALIARRWILNRLSAGMSIPTHLITIAGANHGSTLAHMGKSVLGYLQKLALHKELSVGQGVLTDLEYGSAFLLRLNAEWLDAWNDGRLASLYAFSMGGDSNGGDKDPSLNIFWQTKEKGSDNTVRISGANLNYTIISVQHSQDDTRVQATTTKRRVPHLVLSGYSHYGPATGILGNVHAVTDPPMAAVIAALAVSDASAYNALEQTWSEQTQAWIAKNVDKANSTAIFSLSDMNGSPLVDCMIAILDQRAVGDVGNPIGLNDPQSRATAMSNASTAVIRHSPIHNDSQLGSYSFYLNYSAYVDSSPHWYHIEFGESSLIGQHKYPYGEMLFTQPPELTHTIAPNECTYVQLTVGRRSDEAYAIWGWDPELNMAATTFPPFDKSPAFRLAPPKNSDEQA